MILTVKSLAQSLQKEGVGRQGRSPENFSGKTIGFNRAILLGISLVCIALAVTGIAGVAWSIIRNDLVGLIVPLAVAAIGIYAALGSFREFVNLELITSILPSLPEAARVEFVRILIEQKQLESLVQNLLGMLEKRSD